MPPIICSNGAYLYDPGQDRILAGDPLAVAPLTALLAEVQAQQMGRSSIWGGIGCLGCEEHVGRMRRWSASQPDHLKVSCCRPRISAPGCKPHLEAGAVQPGSRPVAPFRGEVVETLPFTRDWAAPMRWSWCSPVAARATGWPVGGERGIAMENVVAFGDNNNDISMFEQVGWRWPWATRRPRSRPMRTGSPRITTKTASPWRCSAGS